MTSSSLNLALYTWTGCIKDPSKDDQSEDAERCRALILKMIHQEGLGWESWIKSYTGDGAFSWCGAFAAYCSPKVKAGIRYKWFASTYRLSEYGKKDPRRQVKFSDILPGDIVCVGGGNYGSHITLAVAWDKNKANLVTVSGNGEGMLPDGSWGEGVVIKVYPRSDLRAAYRPMKEDYDA